jgi:hypothetical protein
VDDETGDDDQTNSGINVPLETLIEAGWEQLSKLTALLSAHVRGGYISKSTSLDGYYPHGDERSYLEWVRETSRRVGTISSYVGVLQSNLRQRSIHKRP